MREIHNCHQAKTAIIMVADRTTTQWAVGGDLRKYLFSRKFSVVKGKMVTIVKKPSRHHLNHEVKVNIPVTTCRHHGLLGMMPWERHHHICDVLVQNRHSQSNHHKTLDEGKLRHMLQNKWQVLIESQDLKGKR